MWHWPDPFFFLKANPEEFEDATDQFSFKKMLPRDERRFKTADLNGDQATDREEFTAFLHPEEFERMRDIVIVVSSYNHMVIKSDCSKTGLFEFFQRYILFKLKFYYLSALWRNII